LPGCYELLLCQLEQLAKRFKNVHDWHLWLPAGSQWSLINDLLWLLSRCVCVCVALFVCLSVCVSLCMRSCPAPQHAALGGASSAVQRCHAFASSRACIVQCHLCLLLPNAMQHPNCRVPPHAHQSNVCCFPPLPPALAATAPSCSLLPLPLLLLLLLLLLQVQGREAAAGRQALLAPALCSTTAGA
jgi:hypothetical protein